MMTVGTKGQVVIPAEIRRAVGLEPGQKVQVVVEDGQVVLKPLPRDLIAALRGCLADGPSLTEALVREHEAELRRDEERGFRLVRPAGAVPK
jgi:AbrB family looped-hinge helix DNA binding protein